MGQTVLFDGKLYTEPTVQAQTIGGVNNTGAPSSFGNICIIDTGIGGGFGGGVGCIDGGTGNSRQLSEFLQEVNSTVEMKNFVKGGILWDIADYIYNPSLNGNGATKVFIARACSTIPATSSGTTTATDTIAIETKEEGLMCNGALDGSDLYYGYAWKLIAGTQNSSAVVMQLWRGTYRGADSAGYYYDGQDIATSAQAPLLVAQSSECTDLSELLTWAENNQNFQKYFKWGATQSTSGALVPADVATFASFQLFAGGGESYSTSGTDACLAVMDALDNSIFLATESDANATSTNNLKILGYINNNAEWKKFVVIGGGNDASDFTTNSIAKATTLNSQYAILAHSGFKVPYVNNSAIMVDKSSLYMASLVAGRMAGFEPQVPLTFKNLRVGQMNQLLTESERVNAIDHGVLHMRNVNGVGLVINQGINTLQANDFMINNDGTSPEISIERIKAQLNREITEGALQLFIGQNIGTVTSEDIRIYTKGYLTSKLAVAGQQDGLIVDFGNITVVRQGSTYYVTYEFQANSPINKIFFTGIIVDPSLL